MHINFHSAELVKEFHQTYNCARGKVPGDNIEDPDLRRLRLNLIATELCELADALGCTLTIASSPAMEKSVEDRVDIQVLPGWPVNVIEAADALGDIDYVAAGGHIAFGFPAFALVYEIHRSNMSKLAADGSVIYREDGKVLKGPNYFKPNIRGVLELFGLPPVSEGGTPD